MVHCARHPRLPRNRLPSLDTAVRGTWWAAGRGVCRGQVPLTGGSVGSVAEEDDAGAEGTGCYEAEVGYPRIFRLPNSALGLWT